jgi:DNA mismatch repair protein MutL
MFHNNKQVFQLYPSTLKQRIIALFGNMYKQRLVPVEQKSDIVNISGFIGKPEFAKKTRGEQYFFANNRFIKHPSEND